MDLHVNAIRGRAVPPKMDGLSGDLSPLEEPPKFTTRLILPDSKELDSSSGTNMKAEQDDFEASALRRFRSAASSKDQPRSGESPRLERYTFVDGTNQWIDRFVPQENTYQYLQAVVFKPNCLMSCHNASNLQGPYFHGKLGDAKGVWEQAQSGDLACVVSVTLPRSPIQRAINKRRAILITSGLLTAILAMTSSSVVLHFALRGARG